MKTGIYSLLLAINLLYVFGAFLPVNSLLGDSIIKPPSTDTAGVPATGTLPSTETLPSTDSLPRLPETCLVTALSSSSQLRIRTGMLICLNDQELETKLNDDDYEAMYKALTETLTRTFCMGFEFLRTADTPKRLSTPVSEIVRKLLSGLRPVVEKSALLKPSLETLCTLLKPALNSICLSSLLEVDLVQLIIDLQLQACKGQNERIFYKDMSATMTRLKCISGSHGDLQQLPDIETEKIPASLPSVPAMEPETIPGSLPPAPAIVPEMIPAPLPPVPPKESVGTLPVSLVKRDLKDVQLPQGRPKDPVVWVACTAIDLLLKSVTPV